MSYLVANPEDRFSRDVAQMEQSENKSRVSQIVTPNRRVAEQIVSLLSLPTPCHFFFNLISTESIF